MSIKRLNKAIRKYNSKYCLPKPNKVTSAMLFRIEPPPGFIQDWSNKETSSKEI